MAPHGRRRDAFMEPYSAQIPFAVMNLKRQPVSKPQTGVNAPAVYRPPMSRPSAGSLSVQAKPAGSLALESRPAPPVYRPQGRVSQSKPASLPQKKLAAPASLVQPRMADAVARGFRNPAAPVPSVNQHVVQLAATTAWSTTVTATGGGVTKTGHSGNGPTVGDFLTRATNPQAAEFLRILQWINGNGSATGRSAFTCAEPHAVAQVLAASATVQLDDIIIRTAWDSRGGKDTCPICSRWIDKGKITDPRPAPPRARTVFTLADFVKPAKRKKKKPAAATGERKAPAAATPVSSTTTTSSAST